MLYPLQTAVTNTPEGRRTMWPRLEMLAVGKALPHRPVDPAGVVEPVETFPPYLLAYQTVCLVKVWGVASRRYTGLPVFGQNLLGGERVCFPVVEVRMTGIRLRAQQGVQGDQQLRQRASAEQTRRLRSPADRRPSQSIPKVELRWMQVTAPV